MRSQYVFSQVRTLKVLEFRIAEGDSPTDAAIAPTSTLLESVELSNEVVPASGLMPASNITDEWKGKIVAENLPKKKAVVVTPSPQFAKKKKQQQQQPTVAAHLRSPVHHTGFGLGLGGVGGVPGPGPTKAVIPAAEDDEEMPGGRVLGGGNIQSQDPF